MLKKPQAAKAPRAIHSEFGNHVATGMSNSNFISNRLAQPFSVSSRVWVLILGKFSALTLGTHI